MKQIRSKLKPFHMAIAIFFAILMTGNPIAMNLGLTPSQDIIRQFRVRSARRVRSLFNPK